MQQDEFDDLMSESWQKHDLDSEGVAANLERAAETKVNQDQAGQLLKLSNHTIGEHLSNWPRALVVAEAVAQNEAVQCSLVFSQLALARFLAGDGAAAQQAELLCVGAAEADPICTYIEMKARLAGAMIGSQQLEGGVVVFEAMITLADQFDEVMTSDRAVAIASNNLAFDLLYEASRIAQQDELMQFSADAAHRYWNKCGTWENKERAIYLLALVANAMANPEAALGHVEQGLRLIVDNGEEPVDEAFLRIAAAHAHRQLNNMSDYHAQLELADKLAAQWHDDSNQKWYADERAKIV